MNETFERTPPGQRPRSFSLAVENKGDSILVTEETAATGRRSLKITDAPGLQAVWRPHLFLNVNYEQGIVTNSFDLRVEAASYVVFEWRDWSQSDYYTGPMITVRNGRLSAGGQEMALPLNQWVRLTLSADLGAGQLRALAIVGHPAGQPRQDFTNLPYANPKFKKLTWVGFTSNANTNTAFYLDNFSLPAGN